MTYKLTFWRTLTAMTVALLTMPANVWADSTFGGGNGTASAPYQIYNTYHFDQLAADVNAGNTYDGVYFKLTKSVSFANKTFTPIGGAYYTDENGATGMREFNGQFDGNNCSVYDITLSDNHNACGIFGALGYGAGVYNLTLDGNTTIEGIGDVGGIVGTMYNNTQIRNCHVGENVVITVHPDAAGNSYKPGHFGGVVGTTHGRVTDCTSKATVSNGGISKTENLGGIVGFASSSAKVSYCYFLGNVDATGTVGDIAGYLSGGSITSCYYRTANRHGGVNNADTDGALPMSTVSFAEGVSGNLPAATYNDNNTPYFGSGKYMLMTLDYTTPTGYWIDGVTGFMANDTMIGETERAGNPYYEFYMPDTDVTIRPSAAVKRDIAYSAWVHIAIPALTYTGEPLQPSVQVIDLKDNANSTLVEGEHYTVTLPDEIINTGEYTAVLDGIGTFGGSVSVSFFVTPAEGSTRVVTAPAAIEGLTYNGQSQVLVTPGEAENGVMMYRLGGDGEYGTQLPTAVNRGTYIVYYKAYNSLFNIDSPEESVIAQIGEYEGMWSGEGTAEAPYLITTVDDMNRIAILQEEIDYNGVYFSLENDIDFAGYNYLSAGSMTRRFKGNFNGNSHSLTNLIINRPDDDRVALFSVVDGDGVISDLHLGEGCSIIGANYVGAFVGLHNGTVTGCSTAPGVSIKGRQEVGGIIGRSVGTIDRCVNNATVTAENNSVGGIAGSSYGNTSRYCHISNNLNLGAIAGQSATGGIIGNSWTYTTISNNYYAGACSVGGINNNDRDGQAQRGYTVTASGMVNIERVENNTIGLTYGNAIYAGNGQQLTVRLSVADSSPSSTRLKSESTEPTFIASGGTLINNGDGTYTLTLADSDVVISVKSAPTAIERIDADANVDNVWYTIGGVRLPTKPDVPGIYINAGRKVIIK